MQGRPGRCASRGRWRGNWASRASAARPRQASTRRPMPSPRIWRRTSRHVARRGRRVAAARRARDRARAERVLGNAGHDRDLPADAGNRAERTARRAARLVSTWTPAACRCCVIIGESNPVLSAPADCKFADAIKKVALRAHSGLFFDETADAVPLARAVDALPRDVERRAHLDGTVSIVQPLIQPLYGGKSRARNHRDTPRPPGAQRLRRRPRVPGRA